MTDVHACPPDDDLRSLLELDAFETPQHPLVAHLDQCQDCQQRLLELAGDDELLPEEGPRTAAASGLSDELVRVIEAMGARSGATTSDLPLHFLRSARDPSHLGELGHYHILEVVGQGAMGIVLRAFDTALNRIVAIKVLHPNLATSASARLRFTREAQAAAAVSHDHVVTIHAVDQHDEIPYLVMQFVEGESLQERIHRHAPLETPEILRIGMQIASGLAAAHAQGLVHRDIKPANILLENGVARVKITDFGLAKAVDDARLTQSGTVAGTPQYMAPEQANGDPVDHRADLFSLGSVMYAMCTGQPPFAGGSSLEVLRQVCDHQPPSLEGVRPQPPPWLVRIVERLLEKDVQRRYQSSKEVAAVLEARLAELQGNSRQVQTQLDAPARRWWQTRIAFVLGGCLLGLAAAIVAQQLQPASDVTQSPATASVAGAQAPSVPTTQGAFVVADSGERFITLSEAVGAAPDGGHRRSARQRSLRDCFPSHHEQVVDDPGR